MVDGSGRGGRIEFVDEQEVLGGCLSVGARMILCIAAPPHPVVPASPEIGGIRMISAQIGVRLSRMGYPDNKYPTIVSWHRTLRRRSIETRKHFFSALPFFFPIGVSVLPYLKHVLPCSVIFFHRLDRTAYIRSSTTRMHQIFYLYGLSCSINTL